MEKYKKFCEDFQPWSRMLVTFLKIHSANLFPRVIIPDIENTKLYGTFVNKKSINKREFDKLLLLDNFDENLISYIDKENNPRTRREGGKTLSMNKSKSKSRSKTRRVRSRIRTV